MWKKIKKMDYRHYIALAVLLGTAALGFLYQWNFARIREAGRDLGRAFLYMIASFFDRADELAAAQTVNTFSGVNLWDAVGVDMDGLIARWSGVWSQIFVGENFAYYLLFLLFKSIQIIYMVCWVLIVGMIVLFPILMTWDSTNNDYGKDTRPLALWKRFIGRPFRAVVCWCRDFGAFFAERPYFKIFLVMWAFYFGIFTVFVEFFAYWLWLLVSLDLASAGVQLLKLAADVCLCF